MFRLPLVSFLVLAIVCCMTPSARAASPLYLVYAGLQQGMPQPESGVEGEIRSTLFSYLAAGNKGGGAVLREKVGEWLGDRVIDVTDESDLARRIADIKKREKELLPEQLSLAFFTLDDVVLLHSVEASGLHRVSAYTLISFHLFNYRHREITYTSNFVLPVHLKVDQEDWRGTFLRRLTSFDKGKAAIEGYLPKVAAVVANGQRFDRAVRDDNSHVGGPQDGKTRGIAQNFTKVRASAHTAPPGGAPEKNARLSAFAANLLTAQIAGDVWTVPPYATADKAVPVDRRDPRERNVRCVIAKHGRNSLQQLTGYTLTKGSCDTAGVEGDTDVHAVAGKHYELGSNIFPSPARILAADISVSRKKVSSDDIYQQDSMTAAVSAGLVLADPYSPTGLGEAVCTPDGRKPRIAHEWQPDKYVKEYAANSKVDRGDADYYNVLFRLAVEKIGKKDSKERFFGPNSFYGLDDDFAGNVEKGVVKFDEKCRYAKGE